MEWIGPDRRRILAERDPEGIASLVALQPDWLERKLVLARLYWRLDRRAAFVFEGCASIGELAAHLGLQAGEAAILRDVGRALDRRPDIEDLLHAGKLSLDSASVLGELFRHPEAIRPGEDWVRDATVLTRAALRRRVRSRIEAWTQRKAVAALTLYVTDEARDDFAICRDLASRKAKKTLTPGETFGVVVKDYRTRHDPAARESRARRVPPTGEKPESRYVPAEVARALRGRSGGRCEVPGCGHRMGLETCHIRPHARGSGRETWDLLLLCHRHHVIYDLGQLGFAGWTKDGRPTFRAHDGTLRIPPGCKSTPPPSGLQESGSCGTADALHESAEGRSTRHGGRGPRPSGGPRGAVRVRARPPPERS